MREIKYKAPDNRHTFMRFDFPKRRGQKSLIIDDFSFYLPKKILASYTYQYHESLALVLSWKNVGKMPKGGFMRPCEFSSWKEAVVHFHDWMAKRSLIKNEGLFFREVVCKFFWYLKIELDYIARGKNFGINEQFRENVTHFRENTVPL